MNLNHVYILLAVMLLSFLSVNIFRKSIRKNTDDIQEHYVDGVSKFFNKAAIGVLLPILFFESFTNNSDRLNEIIIGVFFGALFAFLTLITGSFITKLISSTQIDSITHVVGATFGGGNRGVVLLIITMSLLSIDDIYFSYFYAVDFGNFMFFLFAIPIYLKKVYKVEEDAPTFTMSSILKDIGISNIIVIVVVILLYLDIGSKIAANIAEYIEPTSQARSFLLLYLSFCLIFLKINIHASHVKVFWNILFITISRLSVLGLMSFFLLMGVDDLSLKSVIENGYLFALIILFLCPPSSLVGGQIDIHTNDNASVSFANTINIWMVGMYFIAICLIFALYLIANKYGFSYL